MITPPTFTPTNHREATIRVHYKEFYDHLIQTFPEDLKWMEKVYWYYNKITSYPVCPTCGKRTKFINFNRGYSTHCCMACVPREEVVKKYKRTCLERYGAESVLSGRSSKRDEIEKACVEKYGGLGGASKTIREKMMSTNRARMGCDMPFNDKKVQRVAHEIIVKKYGACGYGSKELHDKAVCTTKELYGTENWKQSDTAEKYHADKAKSIHSDILDRVGNNFICRCPHPECNKCSQKTYTIPCGIYANRKIQHVEPCTNLLSVDKSRCTNTSIELFVKNILDDVDIKYEQQSNILSPKRVDFYIPTHKLIIECNGIYWHSDKNKAPRDHLNRFCLARKSGYHMITIWEDWVINQPEIVKNLILAKLGIYKNRIGARQCVVKEISAQLYRDFLRNHIQGPCNSKIKYGLFYNDQLVSVMGFGKRRSSMMGSVRDDAWELMRYCVAPGLQIVGGASKLFKHFINTVSPGKVISFSSNDISEGNLYEKLGFVKGATNLSYWYIDKTYCRSHRYKYCKQNLIKLGFDPARTEFDITDSMGLYRIYDTGQTRWDFNR